MEFAPTAFEMFVCDTAACSSFLFSAALISSDKVSHRIRHGLLDACV